MQSIISNLYEEGFNPFIAAGIPQTVKAIDSGKPKDIKSLIHQLQGNLTLVNGPFNTLSLNIFLEDGKTRKLVEDFNSHLRLMILSYAAKSKAHVSTTVVKDIVIEEGQSLISDERRNIFRISCSYIIKRNNKKKKEQIALSFEDDTTRINYIKCPWDKFEKEFIGFLDRGDFIPL
jgi:hypothetical protein